MRISDWSSDVCSSDLFVPEAVTLDALSYSEAAELAYFGAKVLHPMTLVPVLARNIAVIVRNTFKPEHPGTRLSRERQLDQIGSASCRERVCQYVSISVLAGSLKKIEE